MVQGRNAVQATEANAENLVRGAHTGSDMYVNVSANTVNGTTTITSRKNAGAGSMSVSVGSSTTGTFEDLVDSDSLADGDTYDAQTVTAGSSGTIRYFVTITFGSSTFECLQAGWPAAIAGSHTVYQGLGGRITVNQTVEVQQQAIIRYSATWSNLFTSISANTATSNTTVKSRVGAANGSQVLDIKGGTTGTFEDTVDTDSVTSGNLVDYQLATGSNSSKSVTFDIVQSYFTPGTSAYSIVASGPILQGNFGVSPYLYIAGEPNGTLNESNEKTKDEADSLTLSNLFVYVAANTLNGASPFYVRKNAANGSQSVSIGAAATGSFEDATDTDSLVAGDVFNYQISSGGTSGNIQVSLYMLTSTITVVVTVQAFSMPAFFAYRQPVYVQTTPYA
jgi:hypothetical protein